jgi:diadenylate cyclase
MATRMGEEIERNVIELGREGWLIEMQLGELMRDIPRDRVNVIRDYELPDATGGSAKVLKRLAGLSHNRLLDFEVLGEVLGHGGVNPLDLHLRPRGYRALAQIPRLTERQITAVVSAFDGLDSILRASLRELEACDGVSPSAARDIREGLRRLQEHNLMDRYLQL